jgi:hypothetical protein
MSDIKISELFPTGSDLFQDTESFLHELSNQETVMVTGGDLVLVINTLDISTTISQPSINTVVIPSIKQSLLVQSRVTYSIGVSLITASVVSGSPSIP